MTTRDDFEMAEAAAKHALEASGRSAFPTSILTIEPTTSAPMSTIYFPADTRSTPGYSINNQTLYPQHTYHITSSGSAGHPNTIAASQAIVPHQNAPIILTKEDANFMGHGNTINPTAHSGFTRDFSPLNSAACSVACSYCRKRGHSHDICRRQKREVGCLKCGVNGHLAHQCGKATRNQCLYCLKKGHIVANCYQLQREMILCQYCSTTGHTEDMCFKKRRDSGFETLHTNSVLPIGSYFNRHSIPSSVDRSSEANVKSTPAFENASRRDSLKRDLVADRSSVYSGELASIGFPGQVEKNMQDTWALTKLQPVPEPVQTPRQATRHFFPNTYNIPYENRARPRLSSLGDKTIHGNSPLELPDNDKAAHRHSSQKIHGRGSEHDKVVSATLSGFVVNEPTSKRTRSIVDPAGGSAVPATTRHRNKPASIIFISFAPRGTIHVRDVQKPDTAVEYESNDFQRKLMKRRREEAMKLRREQGRSHS